MTWSHNSDNLPPSNPIKSIVVPAFSLAYLTAYITFGLFPLAEIATRISPFLNNSDNCIENTLL